MVGTTARERRWKRLAMVFMVLTLLLAVNAISAVQGALPLGSVQKVNYHVDYDVYDYQTGKTYSLQYSVPSDAYQAERSSVVTKLQIAVGNDRSYAKLVTPNEPLVRRMAEDLYELSGGDEELYTNMALQIAHQMYYSLTPQAKSAVEALVESSGDCDPQAVAVASLIQAANLRYDDFDADVVLFLYWPHKGSDNAEVQWGHMQVGVNLDGRLDDARSDRQDRTGSYRYDGQRYHVGEPTFERGFNPNWREGWRLGENWYPRQPDVVIPV